MFTHALSRLPKRRKILASFTMSPFNAAEPMTTLNARRWRHRPSVSFCSPSRQLPRQVVKLNTKTAELVKLSRAQGFETIGFGGMHQDYAEVRSEVARCETLGLAGIKIHPDIQQVDIDDPRLFPLYDELQSRGMKLYLHMGDERPQYRYSRPSRLAKVLDMFPGLVVIAAHFGSYRAWDEAKEYLWGRENGGMTPQAHFGTWTPKKPQNLSAAVAWKTSYTAPITCHSAGGPSRAVYEA